jgi:hypothetical protein
LTYQHLRKVEYSPAADVLAIPLGQAGFARRPGVRNRELLKLLDEPGRGEES